MYDLRHLKRVAAERYPESSDPSLDAMLHLAAALTALERLEKLGADLHLQGQPLAVPFVERALREAQYLRSRRAPQDTLDVSVITKFGRKPG